MRTEGAAALDPARSRIRSGLFGPSVQLERAAVDVEAGGLCGMRVMHVLAKMFK